MLTFRLYIRPGERIRARMENLIPSFALVKARQKRFGEAKVSATLSASHYLVGWRLDLYAGEPGECLPAWVDTELEIRPPSISTYISNVGELLPGTTIESLPGGEVKGSLVVREFLAAGERVQIADEDENILFSGKVIQAVYNAENDTWVLSATDDLSESGLDEEIPMSRYPDIVDALPYDIDDLSAKTLFPTVPVAGVTVRYWISLLESLRGARLYFDPETERHILSDRPRTWTIAEALSFAQTIDASQYFNVVMIEQDDNWEEAAARETATSEYGEYELTTDRAGEKIFDARLTGPSGLVVRDKFEYNELHQVIKTVSQKGASTTTTTYTIQQGGNPYIRSEVGVTKEPGSPNPFTERRHKTASLLINPDGTMLVMLFETREWFEVKQEVVFE